MNNIQQQETLRYFDWHAKDWARKANINSPNDLPKDANAKPDEWTLKVVATRTTHRS